jgi:hypothetical protein
MAQVTFAHDDRPPVDATLEGIGNGASTLNKPIRCRFQPDLYDWARTSYTAWHGLTWTIDVVDVPEGRVLREALTLFFRAFGGDARRQKRLLTMLGQIAAGGR